ncbi:hypothetical protein BDV96DRAFT_647080 [Lophiotrema nucula]|uniref:MYND-type domain-containing protein n=1 Tax=Lophiotrema nucula TaxID=690887 RepID=A0A6A5Z4M2_9PLEO|nr:hypothetical protein BDV96DRAFT_647080 [Lophiotrema nucula]
MQPDQCGGCHRDEIEGENAFLKCGRCVFRTYCSKTCQVSHWKTHKEECCRLAMKGIAVLHGVSFDKIDTIWMPEALRLVYTQINLRDARTRDPRSPVDPDTIYYIKTSWTTTHEVIGPYHPAETLIQAVKHLLATRYALAEVPIFEDTLETHGLNNMPSFQALLRFENLALAGKAGIEIVRKINPAVAALCRARMPGQRCQVYNVILNTSEDRLNDVKDDIVDTATTVFATNEVARKVIAGWDISEPDVEAESLLQTNGLLAASFLLPQSKVCTIRGVLHFMEDALAIPSSSIADYTTLRAMSAKFW